MDGWYWWDVLVTYCRNSCSLRGQYNVAGGEIEIEKKDATCHTITCTRSQIVTRHEISRVAKCRPLHRTNAINFRLPFLLIASTAEGDSMIVCTIIYYDDRSGPVSGPRARDIILQTMGRRVWPRISGKSYSSQVRPIMPYSIQENQSYKEMRPQPRLHQHRNLRFRN